MNAEVRSLKTPAEQALAEAFVTAKPNLPGLADLRADAFAQFDKQGLPHRRVEEWKYTDLRALWREAKPLASPPDAKAKEQAKKAAQELEGLDCRRLTFVDGAFVPELSDLTAGPASPSSRWPRHSPKAMRWLGNTSAKLTPPKIPRWPSTPR
jgi:Fe-S cluster assembly protein SufD